MQSDYGYELTDRAEKDIDEIAGYIRDELSNASAAMNFLNDVEQCIRRLCDFPAGAVFLWNICRERMSEEK